MFFFAKLETNQTMYFVLSGAGALAGIMILMEGFSFITGSGVFRRHPLAALIPPLWGCVWLVTLFIAYTSVVNVSENIYDTLTVIFLLLFLFAQARMPVSYTHLVWPG